MCINELQKKCWLFNSSHMERKRRKRREATNTLFNSKSQRRDTSPVAVWDSNPGEQTPSHRRKELPRRSSLVPSSKATRVRGTPVPSLVPRGLFKMLNKSCLILQLGKMKRRRG